MARNNTGNEKQRTFVIILIIISLLVIVLAVVFPMMNRSNETILVDIPVVSTSVVSQTTGETHNIQAHISLDVTSNKKISKSTLQSIITNAISTLDYDKLHSENADRYLKTQITASISEYIGEKDLHGVYITDFHSGDLVVPRENNSSQSEIIKGLFDKVE